MRYLKYKNTSKNRNLALKEQYKNLTENENRIVRKEKRWRNGTTILCHILFLSCVFVGIGFIHSIPRPDDGLYKILSVIWKGILILALVIVSGLITAGITSPLWKKVESFHLATMKKEIFSHACSHLREFYELGEPYIVTKCFEATDQHFINRDVCIFVVRDELRITADLVRGFLHGQRDLGCYAFTQEEITLSRQQRNNHPIVELKADNTVFKLGYRAKGFIEKNFAARTNET